MSLLFKGLQTSNSARLAKVVIKIEYDVTAANKSIRFNRLDENDHHLTTLPLNGRVGFPSTMSFTYIR